MKRLTALLFALVASLPCSAADFVLGHINVIDTVSGALREDVNVVVRAGRIAAVGPGAGAGMLQVDARGKFLIPGLWDMHVHTSERGIDLPLYLANGVTGVRDMGGDLDQPTGYSSARYVRLAAWREAIEAGNVLGPRMVLAGFLIDGYAWPGNVVATNADEGRAAVRALKRLGVDFIKVKSGLTEPTYLAIAAEARRLQLPLAGHVPDTVPALEACAAGQASIEHLSRLALATTPDGASLAEEMRLAFAARDRARYQTAEDQAANGFDASAASALLACLRQQRTMMVPTLVELRAAAIAADDVRWRYVPASLRAHWHQADGPSTPARFSADLALVRHLHEAGVHFMAGTDSANARIFPGFALHEELALLHAAGLTPLQALQAATLNPARFLGRALDLGTVEAGKLADLVVLNKNPLLDIANTRAIDAVIVNGRYLARSELDAMLDGAARAAQ